VFIPKSVVLIPGIRMAPPEPPCEVGDRDVAMMRQLSNDNVARLPNARISGPIDQSNVPTLKINCLRLGIHHEPLTVHITTAGAGRNRRD
jgi:hypothetical protein